MRQEKGSAAFMSDELVAKAERIMRDTEIVSIGKIDDKGYPRVSTINSIKTDGLKKVWFSSGLRSGKVKFFKQNSKASVCYREGGSNITLIGDIAIKTDHELKEQLWKDWFINHFPGGVTDPNYCILEFTTREAILWIDNEYKEIML
jgi:general stress protein 26